MKPAHRKQARVLALQALYGWLMSGNDIKQIELSMVTTNDMKKVDMEYFQAILAGVSNDVVSLDKKYKPYLGRLPEELDPIEKSIMRLATYELLERFDTPFKVIINEAIELAKSFGAEESHKFINGALDKAVKTLRKDERT
ncbi:transcription antitermination factor NusB [Glaciecola petra]|uniref:Transcription antitermination protein NusB n=1 Tax=Glaciecola petra TaxID=3075602 RepID=A0ABU2ZT19_9ALTE|nr:transcription antitermination factor NusB [Aestuariibacter sp. P117]MDT0595783.1 transcription antitermination factor NusB [Aestuariibacter sp. P117]